MKSSDGTVTKIFNNVMIIYMAVLLFFSCTKTSFSESVLKADQLVIESYHTMNDKKPKQIIKVAGADNIKRFFNLYFKLPEEGILYKKLAPTSSLLIVKVLSENRVIKVIEIYNNQIKMKNTAFLGPADKDDEEKLVKLVLGWLN